MFESQQGKDAQTGSGAHPAFCLVDIGVNSHQSIGLGVNHSPLYGAEIKNDCSHFLLPMYAFVVWTWAVLALEVQRRKIKRRYNGRHLDNLSVI